jgi:hypothetical protein
MTSHSSGSGQDIVYLDFTTSGVGAALYESSADPTGLASVMPDFFVFYSSPVPISTKQRVPGLHLGALWASEDFDEPLPEEFWTSGG